MSHKYPLCALVLFLGVFLLLPASSLYLHVQGIDNPPNLWNIGTGEKISGSDVLGSKAIACIKGGKGAGY